MPPALPQDCCFRHSHFFGFAQAKEDGCYPGFSYGKRTSVFLDASLLLIEPVAAAGYAEAQRAVEKAARPNPTNTAIASTGGGASGAEDSAKPTYPAGGGSAPQATKKQFYGSIEPNVIQAKKQFADLVDEVALQFTSRPGVKVRLAIGIRTRIGDRLRRGVATRR